ncbi:MAG: hypothetical protein SGPRY_001858 [Prymnesium sp.]
MPTAGQGNLAPGAAQHAGEASAAIEVNVMNSDEDEEDRPEEISLEAAKESDVANALLDLSSLKDVRISVSKVFWRGFDFYSSLDTRIFGTPTKWASKAALKVNILWDDGQVDLLHLAELLPSGLRLEAYKDNRPPPHPKRRHRDDGAGASHDDTDVDLKCKRGGREFDIKWSHVSNTSLLPFMSPILQGSSKFGSTMSGSRVETTSEEHKSIPIRSVSGWSGSTQQRCAVCDQPTSYCCSECSSAESIVVVHPLETERKGVKKQYGCIARHARYPGKASASRSAQLVAARAGTYIRHASLGKVKLLALSEWRSPSKTVSWQYSGDKIAAAGAQFARLGDIIEHDKFGRGKLLDRPNVGSAAEQRREHENKRKTGGRKRTELAEKQKQEYGLSSFSTKADLQAARNRRRREEAALHRGKPLKAPRIKKNIVWPAAVSKNEAVAYVNSRCGSMAYHQVPWELLTKQLQQLPFSAGEKFSGLNRALLRSWVQAADERTAHVPNEFGLVVTAARHSPELPAAMYKELCKKVKSLAETKAFTVNATTLRPICLAFIHHNLGDAALRPGRGGFTCSRTWLCRLAKAAGLRWRKPYGDVRKAPANAAALIHDLIPRLTYLMKEHDVPPCLVVNFDHTGLHFMQIRSTPGEKVGFELCGAGSNDASRLERTWIGHMVQTSNHWANAPTFYAIVDYIIVPWLEAKKRALAGRCYARREYEDFRVYTKRHYPWIRLLYITAACTDLSQPEDRGMVAWLKGSMRKYYSY